MVKLVIRLSDKCVFLLKLSWMALKASSSLVSKVDFESFPFRKKPHLQALTHNMESPILRKAYLRASVSRSLGGFFMLKFAPLESK